MYIDEICEQLAQRRATPEEEMDAREIVAWAYETIDALLTYIDKSDENEAIWYLEEQVAELRKRIAVAEQILAESGIRRDSQLWGALCGEYDPARDSETKEPPCPE